MRSKAGKDEGQEAIDIKSMPRFAEETAKRISSLPDTFGESLAVLMGEKGITLNEMGIALGVSEKTISRLRNGENDPNKSFVIGICVVLKLTVIEAYYMLEKAGYYLRKNNKQDIMYLWIMQNCRRYRIDNINKTLTEAGVPPLGRWNS